MAKKFQIVLMIFCLGIFIFPKQIFVVEKNEMSCCKKEKPSTDCCGKTEKSAPCKDSKNKSHSCDGNCSNCSSCAFTIVFIGGEILCSELKTQNNISNKVEKIYLQPNFSKLSKAIWQPPKIS